MKKIVKNIIGTVVFLSLLAGILLYLNKAFKYEDISVWSTDSRMETYEKLPENSLDVLFVGSSNIMSGINPVQLWNETQIQSYNYSSRAQTFPFTYAYLLQALKTQSPQCVVVDAYSLFCEKTTNGIINTDFHFGVNMDSLKLSPAKMELINNYVASEDRLSYVFPLLKNHNYYKSWESGEDDTDQIFMGYCFADSSEYFETPQYTDKVTDMSDVDATYMKKIIDLCKEKQIDLIVIKVPVVYSDDEHSVLNGLKKMCDENDVTFIDMSVDATDWGFDFQSDMLNYFHVNTSGAQKVTSHLGSILEEKYDFGASVTHQYADVWQQEYERMVQFRTADTTEQ